jgi:hypothetical protein
MPVKRERISIADRRQINPANAPRTNVGSAMGALAESLANQANQYAQIMATEAEDKAKAWVRAAVLTTDENGMPAPPENITEGMGSIARRVYDEGIYDKMTYQMGVAIDNQINEAKNANMYDMEAFNQDASARLDSMFADVPEAMQGAYQQLRTKAMVDAGATIGRSQALLQQEVTKENWNGIVENDVDGISQNILLGNDQEAALQLEMAIGSLMEEKDHILNPSEKLQKINQIMYAMSKSRVQRDFNTNDMTVAQLDGMIAELLDPEQKNIEFLREYFPAFDMATNDLVVDADGQVIPDRAAAKKFVSELQQIKGGLYAQEAKEQKEREEAGKVSLVADGQAPTNPSNQTRLDRILMGQLKDVGYNGPINADTWRSGVLNEKQRTTTMYQMKRSGMIPMSLARAFRSVNSDMDDDQLANMYELYTDMRFAPSGEGNVSDISHLIPEKVLASFLVADAIHGDGGGYNEHFRDALRMAETYQDPQNQWDLSTWNSFLNKDGFKMLGDKLTDENLDASIDNYLINNVLDSNYRVEELGQARTLFKVMFQQNAGMVGEYTASNSTSALDRTTSLVENAMASRFVESDYIVQKSMYAPEKFYPEPMPENILEVFSQLGKKALGNLIKADEQLVGDFIQWVEIINPFSPLRPPSNDVVNPDLGSARLLAGPFDFIVNDHINQLIEDGAFDPLHMKKKDRSLWEAGVHYRLIPLEQHGYPPQYKIQMLTKDQSTGHIVDEKFNPAPAYQKLTGSLFSLSGVLEGPAGAEIMAEAIKEGRWDPYSGFDDDFDFLIERGKRVQELSEGLTR